MQDRKKDTDVYNGLLDSEGEGGMIWENGIVTCILSCKNRIASLGLTQDTACLGLVPIVIVKNFENKSFHNLSCSEYVLEQLTIVRERMYHIEVPLIPHCTKALIKRRT